jgi:hypothetical protein
MKLSKYTKEAIVRAIFADLPKIDKSKRKTEIQANIVKLMSAECQVVYNRTPRALKTKYLGDVISHDGYHAREVFIGDADEKKIDQLCEVYVTEDEAREKARRQLSAAVMGYTTLNALKKAFPEFEKYLPTEDAPTKNLPALANVVADLSKLGWPKK